LERVISEPGHQVVKLAWSGVIRAHFEKACLRLRRKSSGKGQQ
jgi:hypothetical protein